MKILVTGGAGFIGSHLSEKLLKKGHQVTIIDNLSTGKFENIDHLTEDKNFNYKIETILDKELLEELIKDCDRIYHLAAAVGVEYIINNPLKSLEINITGTENILKLANKYKKKVLITSTSEIYGKSEQIPFKEDNDRLLGSTNISRWGYSAAKAIDEFLALAYYREKKLPVVIARCFNTVGPRQTGEYGMVIPKFVKNALLGHNITIFGTGKQTRCFADVDDVSTGLINLMNSKEAEGQIFNIGNDQPISIENLAKKVKKLTNSDSKIKYVKYEDAYEEGFEDMIHRKPDLTKIKKAINYKIKHDLDSILKRVENYYEK